MKYSGFLKEHSQLLMWSMRVSDCLVLMLSGWLSAALVLDAGTFRETYTVAVVIASLLSFSVYPFLSVYRTWRGATYLEEVRILIVSWTALFVILAVLSVITKTSTDYSRLWLGCWYFMGLVALIGSRLLLRYFLAYIRKIGMNQRRIVIVGASDLGQVVAAKINSSPWYGYDIVGFFTDLENVVNNKAGLSGKPVLGATDEVARYVNDNNIDQVWIAISMEKVAVIRAVMDSLATSAIDIRYIPDIFSFSLLNHSVTEVAGMPVVNLSVTPMDGVNRLVKGVEDKVLAAIILMLISPIMAVLAICVKTTSPGPVFYRQERVSWNGESFNMLKFRSMPVDAEKGGVKWGGSQGKATHSFGRFIRKTSLDELPQFINVLLGDMSIVGPRPERTVFVEQFKHEIPGYMQKHKVKAGITGWAQINGWRGDTDLNERIKSDLYYIENWTLWFDIKIILMTLFKGDVNKNAC